MKKKEINEIMAHVAALSDEKLEKEYLSEYADMLGYLCEKRNIKLLGDK